MRHWKTALTALIMLAAACGGDTTTETTAPEVTIERPTINTEAPPPPPTTASPEESSTASEEDTETVTPEPESAATETETPPAETVECPEGTVPIDEGGCLHVPDETPEGEDAATEDVTTEDMDPQEECEASDGVWDADISTCTQPDTEDAPEGETLDTDDEASESLDEAGEEPDITEVPPDHVVVYEGIATEEGCLVAGATWIDNQCFGLLYDDPEDAGISVYWHPRLMDDAFDAVDPHTVEAAHWETFEIGGPWGFYNYAAFYHFDSVSDEDREAQLKALQQVSDYAVRWAFMYTADWLYFPYRYDVSWDDQPDTSSWSGAYPLGENAP